MWNPDSPAEGANSSIFGVCLCVYIISSNTDNVALQKPCSFYVVHSRNMISLLIQISKIGQLFLCSSCLLLRCRVSNPFLDISVMMYTSSVVTDRLNKNIVNILIAKGANRNLQNTRAETPFPPSTFCKLRTNAPKFHRKISSDKMNGWLHDHKQPHGLRSVQPSTE